MGFSNQFFTALGLKPSAGKSLSQFSKNSGIPLDRLHYYNESNILPTGSDLDSITKLLGISEVELMLSMGRVNTELLKAIQENSKAITNILSINEENNKATKKPNIVFKTKLGKLYQEDCIQLLKSMQSESVDLVFADPPFNLSKLYPSKIDDSLKTEKYISWCEQWLKECIRVLKPGGSLFLWSLPKWNAALASYLGGYLTFRHWIGVDIKYTLPISGRLYPSHYSLLYFVKGSKPNTFHPDRLAMLTCPKCYGDLKDYGGYKDKMNPLGVSLTDIWTDIPPVRHAKYKRRIGANELSLKLLDRIIEMSSNPGDVVFDPFGGSGTTYMAAELKGRKWVGCEIGPVEDIVNRFSLIQEEREILKGYRSQLNCLFPKELKKKRLKNNLWVCETFHEVTQ